MKYGINKINTKLFTQQIKWHGGKGVELHPYSPRIKLVANIGILIEYFVPT